MEIQFLDLISRKERKKDITYKVVTEPFYFEGDYIKPLSEVDVNGEVTSDNDIITIKAHIKVDLELKCSRCLDTFIYPIDIDIEERFTNDSNSEDEAIIVIDDVLDINEVVETSIISTLPIKRVCKTNCKGLCQTCGCNLNHGSCTCDKEDVDVRFEVLKGFFKNKEV